MDSDRDLLELAAKAAGLDTHWGNGWQADTMFRSLPRPNSPLVANVEWNPLTDDGDALRLAVKLGIDTVTGGGRTIAYCQGLQACEYHGDDPYAATRLAIVRAAAAIGRASDAA